MSSGITVTEWMQELEALNTIPAQQDGLTAQEIQEQLNIGRKRALQVIREGIKSGLLEPSRKQIIDIAGRHTSTFCYIHTGRGNGYARADARR